MKSKGNILREIKNITSDLESFNDISFDYVGDELRELQGLILITFAGIESGLEGLIILRIVDNCQISYSSVTYKRLTASANKLLEKMSYKQKLTVLNSYKSLPRQLRSLLNRIYPYRNEFAHPSGYNLREKYNYNTEDGKQNIFDLLSLFQETKNELNNYFSQELGVLDQHKQATSIEIISHENNPE